MGYLINGATKANIFSCENEAFLVAFNETFSQKNFYRKIIAIITIELDITLSGEI